MAQLRISDKAEQHLREWLEALTTGEIELWGLPPSVAAFYFLGEAEGRRSRQTEIDHLSAELNRWHMYATSTDKERIDAYNARIAQGLTHATEAQWQQIEADLHKMAGKQSIETDTTSAVEGNANAPTGSSAHRSAQHSETLHRTNNAT